MLSFSHKFIVRPINTKGLLPISLQVIIHRKRKIVALKMTCNEWNEKKQRINGKTVQDVNNNILLDQIEQKIRKILFDVNLKKQDLSLENFIDLLFKKKTSSNFYIYTQDYLDRNKSLYASNTLRAYKAQVGKLKRFKDQFNIKDINLTFLEDYFMFLLKSGNNKNTAYKSMAFVKVIIKQALKEQVIKINPFDNFKIKSIEGNRPFLTKEEVSRIETFYHQTKNEKLKKVAQHFLFSCYTGLRYSDIKVLKKENIINDIIEIQMQKTSTPVRVPINKKAKALIIDNESLYIFKVMSNQKTNDYLKDIAKLCKIEKPLSFHVSRHTFATLAISLGIPIEVISKILGHSDIKTTQIYSKIADEVKIEQLNKFDDL